MAHERFFYTEIGNIDRENGELKIRGEEHHHLSRVLRMRVDAEIHVGDKQSMMYQCKIQDIGPEETLCKIEEAFSDWGEEKQTIHLAVGIIKESHWEWMIEKAVELGVSEITPLLCTHVVKKKLRQERSEKIILAASKQCGRTQIPTLNFPVVFEEFLAKSAASRKIILDNQEEGQAIETYLSIAKSDLTILVGPEGGFSKQEVDFAKKMDYLSATLGVRRLRTETAAIAALVRCSAVKGD
ncbi:MAG: 16S rRNA (uracil(1498)-N(3))-methyltransferase [Candidatus Marinimicrobia bacterium]|nr:16S rRNA (uracil(1498)-N(3))-methyltransferase [Candidatus Neomarinimicrobiota bacterium]